ncbi:MAG: zinc ABC transporter substrate-binding protein [Bdellovibrionales bacterium]|nr:zinc ABC transporter substrate-binding protein [Bdellovibrionales bacterium]
MKQIFLVTILLLFFSPLAFAKLNVVTTISDLRAVAEEVGGEHVSVEGIAKGTQDPHFIEAKPSFMIKVSRADLLVSVGLDLEVGWLPSLMQGARNPKIAKGKSGFLEVGSLVQPIEVTTGKVSRAAGDVHPLGNPHVTLDPKRLGDIAVIISKRLGELDPGNAVQYERNAKSLQSRLITKSADWKARIERSGIKKIVSYHKTLSYFFDRFQISNEVILEPKPGLPPTSGHILNVIDLMKNQKISLILVENYFDPTVTNKIVKELPNIRIETVAVAVDGSPQVKTIDDLFEKLVASIEGKN